MSEIKIVSRWDREKVLYVAADAADVKEALTAAREAGADLAGAYLAGADLGGAYLTDADLGGADLRGADLGGANLGDAYLRGANLGGAYLGGAYLRGANLGDANLAGADLAGAYLAGAYLVGADLGDEMWSQVADVLQRALSKISIDGHWIKGSLKKTTEDGEQAYCAIGAIRTTDAGTARTVAEWLLASVSGGSIESFNDASETTLEDVQAVFSVAIMHARRWAGTAKAKA